MTEKLAALDRRKILKAGASLAAVPLLFGSFASAQAAQANILAESAQNKLKIICIEEHITDSAIAKASQKAVMAEAGYAADWGIRVEDNPSRFTPDRPRLVSAKFAVARSVESGAARIAEMDKHGIDMQVLSYGGFPQMIPADQSIDLIRAANDRLAKMAQAHPARFSGFAALPWQVPEKAAEELERAVKVLGLKGTMLSGRPGKTFLDDARYATVLATLNELGVPLYVHPGIPLPAVQAPYYGGFDRELSARLSLFGWGWHNEAGIQILRMMLSGVFDKYPNLQIISGHWGEMVPFYLQRLDDMIPQEVSGLSRSISQIYREHVHVTPSGMLDQPHFEFIHKVLGADRILFSVDYPYLTLDGARTFIERLPISQEDKEKIAYRNAERLLRL